MTQAIFNGGATYISTKGYKTKQKYEKDKFP